MADQGITAAFWLGVACYVVAWLAYALAAAAAAAAAPLRVRPLGAETAGPERSGQRSRHDAAWARPAAWYIEAAG